MQSSQKIQNKINWYFEIHEPKLQILHNAVHSQYGISLDFDFLTFLARQQENMIPNI